MEGVIESVDFDAEKLANTEHSLERLEKSLAEATCEIANSRITVAKLSDTVSRQERHSRSFNIRVLGVREENTENGINILERIIGKASTRQTTPHHRAVLQPGCPGQRDEIGPRQVDDDPLPVNR